MRPSLIIFASGTKDDGGSGFENLVHAVEDGVLNANIVAVVSNNEKGGVHARATRLNVPFEYYEPKTDQRSYSDIVAKYKATWCALSGWLRIVKGLDPSRTFNIHPALLSQFNGRFGGEGMYGDHIHEAVKAAFDAGEIEETGFTMHFITDKLDRGPAFFEHRVALKRGMSVRDIAKAVNEQEHEWQPRITNLVISGKISWDGSDPSSLRVPAFK